MKLDEPKQELDIKKAELNELIDHKMEGHILRAKAQIIEEGEKNSKNFANLEKKKAENKVVKRLNVNNHIITEQEELLKKRWNFIKKYIKSITKQTQQLIFSTII